MERQLIDHIAFGVRDYEASRAFYERALAPLGIKLTAEVDADNRAAAFGLEGRDDFWIDEGRPLGRMHVAFEAASSDEVANAPAAPAAHRITDRRLVLISASGLVLGCVCLSRSVTSEPLLPKWTGDAD